MLLLLLKDYSLEILMEQKLFMMSSYFALWCFRARHARPLERALTVLKLTRGILLSLLFFPRTLTSLNKLNMKQRYFLEIILGTISNELGLQKNDFFEQLSRAQEITGSVAWHPKKRLRRRLSSAKGSLNFNKRCHVHTLLIYWKW